MNDPTHKKKTVRQWVSCLTTEERISQATFKNIVTIATAAARRMFMHKRCKDKVTTRDMKLDIETDFTEVEINQSKAYRFEVSVHYRQRHFTVILTLCPFAVPGAETELGLTYEEKPLINLLDVLQTELRGSP